MTAALIILSAIFTFIASKNTKTIWALITFGALVPFFIIVIFGYLLNVAPDTQIETNRVTDYISGHVVEWIIADIFGVVIGAAVSTVTDRSK